MKEWFTSMELVSLPGMPTTVQGVRYRAKSEQFNVRKCSDGKGSEYHISSLPIETRRYLAESRGRARSSCDRSRCWWQGHGQVVCS